MTKEKKITVVTITYNQEKYIEQTIKSIVSQKTDFNFDYIISDDNSTDNTRKIIEKYHKKYSNIIKPVYREKNLGSMLNFAETLNIVDAKYLAICDGDDFWTDENKLQKQVDFLENNKKFDICFHQTKIFFEDKSRKAEICPLSEKTEFDLNDLLKENMIPANTVVYRWKFRKKDSFKKIFPIDMVPGDHFVHLLHLKEGKAKLLKEVMSAYRRHEGGMWWFTANSNDQHLFSLKYGKKLLNFYRNVTKEFNLPISFYDYYNKQLAINLIKAYLAERKFDDLAIFEKDYKELYDNVIKELSYTNPYDNLSKIKRIFYLLIFDSKTFKLKIMSKIKNLLKK